MNKKIYIGAYVLLVIILLLGNCNNSRTITKLSKKMDSLQVQLNNKPSIKDLKIEGYEISKRMLYDNNSVVRTTKRPDDIMFEYDNKIKELQK